MPKKDKAQDKQQQSIDELTQDLQRTRADFENFRKRMELDKAQSKENATATTIMKILPVIDNIDRAVAHMPDDLKENNWAQGVAGLAKNLDKALAALNVERIKVAPNDEFDTSIHEAIQMEEGEGNKEVVTEVLQAGYLLNGSVIRHAMVKVGRR